VRCIELVGDATPFGAADYELFIAYSPDIDRACFLSPLKMRRLKWRCGNAGDAMTEQDLASFAEHGFATKTRMAAYDMLRALNQKLRNDLPAARLDLGSFTLPEMSCMPANFVQEWSGNQWVRVPRGAARVSGVPHPQLPREILAVLQQRQLRDLKELGVTWDSASWDIAASNFMRAAPPQGLGLNGEDCEDVYHRSWNNFKAAMDECQITPCALAMHLGFGGCNFVLFFDCLEQVLLDDLLQCLPFIAPAPPPPPPLLLVASPLLLLLLILSSCPAIAPPTPPPRLVLAYVTLLSHRFLCRCFTES